MADQETTAPVEDLNLELGIGSLDSKKKSKKSSKSKDKTDDAAAADKPVEAESEEKKKKKKKEKKAGDEGAAEDLAAAVDGLTVGEEPKKKKKSSKKRAEGEEGEASASTDAPVEDALAAELALGDKKKKKKKSTAADGAAEEAAAAKDAADAKDAKDKEAEREERRARRRAKEAAKSSEVGAGEGSGVGAGVGRGGGAGAGEAGGEGGGGEEEEDEAHEGFEVDTGADGEEDDGVSVHRSYNPDLWQLNEDDYPYEEILARAIDLIRAKNPELGGQRKKYTVVAPQCMREGSKKTVFMNFQAVCDALKRTTEHVFSFLLAELGTTGNLGDSNKLVFKGRFFTKNIETVLKRYITEYVLCRMCRSMDTTLERDSATRLYFLKCKQCAASRTVGQINSGFSAQIGKRKKVD